MAETHEIVMADRHLPVKTLMGLSIAQLEGAAFGAKVGSCNIRPMRPLAAYEAQAVSGNLNQMLENDHLPELNDFLYHHAPISQDDRTTEMALIAFRLNHARYLTAAQVFAVSNYNESAQHGTYSSADVVGEETGSLFTTPIEYVPDYRAAYARHTLDAFDIMSGQRPFSEQEPCLVTVVGDPNATLANQVIDTFQQRGVPPEQLLVRIVDNSQPLLHAAWEKLNKTAYPVQTVPFDARSLGYLFDSFPYRGVVLAEELLDAIPPEIYEVDRQTGKVMLPVLQLGGGLRGAAFEKELKDLKEFPAQRKLLSAWLSMFPYYQDIIKALYKPKAIPGVKPEIDDPQFPLQTGTIRFMQSLGASHFQGYVLGGDYGGFFRSNKKGQIISLGQAVRSMTNAGSSSRKGGIEAAMGQRADVSADVDPELLRYAPAFGLQLNTVCRMGDFMANPGEDPLTDAELQHVIDREVKELERIAPTGDRNALQRFMERTLSLEESFSGNRFNFVLSKGNLPQLPV